MKNTPERIQSISGGKTMEPKKKRKKWPWILLAIAAVLIILVVMGLNGARNAAADLVTYDTYTVAPGSITSSVTGSGELESADTENIDVPNGMRVAEVFAEAGDKVTAGETLAMLDAASLADRAAYLTGELSSLDIDLARMGAGKTTEYVYSPAKGRLKYCPAAEGGDVIESVSEYGALAIISTDGLMQVEIESDQPVAVSSEVVVKWKDGSEEGAVAQRTETGYLITLDDANAPYGETAEVYAGAALLGEGTLEIHAPATVYATGGTISKVYYDPNDRVNANSRLFALENKPFSSGYWTTYSERADVAEQLESVLKYIDNPGIAASTDGVIGSVNVKKGEDTGSDAAIGVSTAFVVHTGGAIKMKVAVDEMDIHSVALGQTAGVTLDAVPSETFEAKVTRISNLGNVTGSITTFAVELTLSPDERFLEGMNGDATILVDQVDNVLIIPVEAINEDASGAFVYLDMDGDREKAYITTGVSDGVYAEVTSGLSQGDVIQYTKSSAASLFDEMSGPFGGMRSGG